jgi:hypothetical protein
MRWTKHGLIVIALITLVIALVTIKAVGQTTFRDASGRGTGTATTDSQGTTVFRDAGGRTIGTASPNGTTGSTTFRDAGGRTTGTASTPIGPRR